MIVRLWNRNSGSSYGISVLHVSSSLVRTFEMGRALLSLLQYVWKVRGKFDSPYGNVCKTRHFIRHMDILLIILDRIHTEIISFQTIKRSAVSFTASPASRRAAIFFWTSSILYFSWGCKQLQLTKTMRIEA